jgi:hypothetical protein
MKKLIFGMLVAVSLTACNSVDSVESEGEGDSTTVKTIDTIVKPVVDTIK